jgi:hypothetical protein
MRSDLACFNLEQKTLRPVRHEVVTHVLGTTCYRCLQAGQSEIGGEGGIRTPDRLAPMPHFECGAFDHSATSPGAMTGRFGPRSGRVLGEEGGADKARGREIRAKTGPMAFGKRGGTARRDKKLTAPCRCFEILAGKCGFDGQPERRNDGSEAERNGNANPVLT